SSPTSGSSRLAQPKFYARRPGNPNTKELQRHLLAAFLADSKIPFPLLGSEFNALSTIDYSK
ncbi:hypothetical protein ABTN40_20210, partial [Acinetobacter baumannii]